MAKRLTCSCWLRRLQQPRRSFTTIPRLHTDGVFRALTENRITTPWIEALQNKENAGHDANKPSGKPETPSDRHLSPKRMSDSYHSVVLPLARDPWLLDTYANSSGHIRLGTLFMDLDALSSFIFIVHVQRLILTRL
jgi:acyl-coenzyme A thioesterase 9